MFTYINMTPFTMVKWFCSSTLCYNNFRTRTSNGLPRDAKIQCKYKKILNTEGINWKSGHICCEHWSEGMEKDNNDLPNLTVQSTQIPIIEKNIKKLKKDMEN